MKRGGVDEEGTNLVQPALACSGDKLDHLAPLDKDKRPL